MVSNTSARYSHKKTKKSYKENARKRYQNLSVKERFVKYRKSYFKMLKNSLQQYLKTG